VEKKVFLATKSFELEKKSFFGSIKFLLEEKLLIDKNQILQLKI
jgi:hypothetical protein